MVAAAHMRHVGTGICDQGPGLRGLGCACPCAAASVRQHALRRPTVRQQHYRLWPGLDVLMPSLLVVPTQRVPPCLAPQRLVCPREVVWLNGAPGSGKGTNMPFIMKSRGLSRAIGMSQLLDTSPDIKARRQRRRTAAALPARPCASGPAMPGRQHAANCRGRGGTRSQPAQPAMPSTVCLAFRAGRGAPQSPACRPDPCSCGCSRFRCACRPSLTAASWSPTTWCWTRCWRWCSTPRLVPHPPPLAPATAPACIRLHPLAPACLVRCMPCGWLPRTRPWTAGCR